MSFQFDTEKDQIFYSMCKKLIKESDGTFQKPGHIFAAYENDGMLRYNYEDATSDQLTKYAYDMFGVTVDFAGGQHLYKIDAMTRWADYGSRSMIPVMYVFITDTYGVVEHWKVGGSGNLRDGWKPDGTKSKLLWERPNTWQHPEWIDEFLAKKAQEELDRKRAILVRQEKMESTEITEGRRVITGKVISTKIQDGEWGSSLKMLVEDQDGIRYFGTVPASIDVPEPGVTVEFTGTVKIKDTGFAVFTRPAKARIIE